MTSLHPKIKQSKPLQNSIEQICWMEPKRKGERFGRLTVLNKIHENHIREFSGRLLLDRFRFNGK
jgi:hypothetical protein